VHRQLLAIITLVWGCVPHSVLAQTPSPLQEWQYENGIVLEKLFAGKMPTWQRVVGVSVATQPTYPGSKAYEVEGGPVFDIRYKDIAFFSVGEGLGVNLLRGKQFRAGVALGFDRGRHVSDDYPRLHGLADIGNAPTLKAFASAVISKRFPAVVRVDIRQILAGSEGWVGDVQLYTPLPGGSERFVMFAGPSITLASRAHMQKWFGVNPEQSAASGLPAYYAHGGATAAGMGFSATKFFSPHWLLNLQTAVSRRLQSAAQSPITSTTTDGIVALSFEYRW
jgi:outer membrane scaffolding protein for murein synthesis (MipA/OmpV family)